MWRKYKTERHLGDIERSYQYFTYRAIYFYNLTQACMKFFSVIECVNYFSYISIKFSSAIYLARTETLRVIFYC